MPGEWARLELTEPLCRAQALAFLSTTEFSIDGGWLNKRKLLSNSLRRNFSFLTTSTPSTAATTSAEKSYAFAKSCCSHRLMFFFGCQHKGRGGDFPVRSYTKTYKLVIGQLWYIFRLNSFGGKFRNKRLEFEVLQNTLHDVFFLHKLIEMWWLPASTILLSLTTRKSRNWGPLKTGLT